MDSLSLPHKAVQHYTNMDQWWGQYGVLWIWGNNIDRGEVEVNIVAKDP